jgi:hypothetical protein
MKLINLVPLALILAAGTSFADSYKHIAQSISGADFERLKLELTVGQLAIEVWDEDSVGIDIELRAERSWFSWRRRSIEDLELVVKENGAELFLSMNERNIEQEWILKVPAKLAMDIEMDAGAVRIKALSNSLALELGVGSVDVVTEDVDFHQIQAAVGVGDATLRGFENGSKHDRSFISADAFYQGDGEHQIQVELGVGDVAIRRKKLF